MKELIKPKKIEVTDTDGNKLTYTISRLNAIDGREIIAKYPLSSVPKIGDYEVNKETMFKLMSHVAVEKGENLIRLNTEALINNHIPDGETLFKIEFEMLRYNVSFLQNGKALSFLESIKGTLQNTALKTLTSVMQSSLKKN